MKTSKKAKSKKRKAGSLPLYFERLEAAEKICEEVAKDEYQTMRIFTLLQRWQALKQALKQVSEKPS